MASWAKWMAFIALFMISSLLYRIAARIRRRNARIRDVGLMALSDPLKPNLEIVAVHGLGADPEYTWMSKPSAKNENAQRVHLLRDLLVSDFEKARILSFSYNSDWLVDAPTKTSRDIALELKKWLKQTRSPLRLPLIFVGHSFGGIVIKEMLLECQADSDDTAQDILNDTRGIIFLGSPHQGSSLSMLATIATNLTAFLGSNGSLVLPLQHHNAQLLSLERRFKNLRKSQSDRNKKIQTISFCETKPTYFGWISFGLIVDQTSATGNADEEILIDTDHSGLNKCGSKDDQLYKTLRNAIDVLQCPSPLELADQLIHRYYSTQDRLKIERLSGDPLSMDQCYINLAIIEQSGAKGEDEEAKPRLSDMSLFDRLGVHEPDEEVQVDLRTLFNPREGQSGSNKRPRRILIRGRAGVGKTTLCKKIVHDYYIQRDNWTELFDRLLWVPLRKLKGQNHTRDHGADIASLLYDEYFSRAEGFGVDRDKCRDLAQILCQALNSPDSKTLFILDGLDEVIQDLDPESDSFYVLRQLLNYPDVIITSRPSGKLPTDFVSPDLELETIGFYPEQVNKYLGKNALSPNHAQAIEIFLENHTLLQGLVRIPIQLDAFCFTWNDPSSDTEMQTMSDIYRAIEQKLCRKDIVRLEKKFKGELLPTSQIPNLLQSDVRDILSDEIGFLECLAFAGLYNDVIEFNSEHLEVVSEHFKRLSLPNIALPRLSFLRTQDNRSYHFLHLTFQEYFAAKYFTSRWEKGTPLDCLSLGKSSRGGLERVEPEKFLAKHKYTPYYDVFWRFVAGLHESEKDTERFFQEVEKQPRDLLGPTHQRLLMRCLNEANHLPQSVRNTIEQDMFSWSKFDLSNTRYSRLVREMEFPERVLMRALQEGSTEERIAIIWAMRYRPRIPTAITELLISWLKGMSPDEVRKEVHRLLRDYRHSLPEAVVQVLVDQSRDMNSEIGKEAFITLSNQHQLPYQVSEAIIGQLKNQDPDIRQVAAQALDGQSKLSIGILQALAALLEDQDPDVRRAAAKALKCQSSLPINILQALATRLEDQDPDIREAAVEALYGQSKLSIDIFQALVARLEDQDPYIREIAIRVLGTQSSLSINILQTLTARLEDQDPDIRFAASNILGSQPSLSIDILQALVARLEDHDIYIRIVAIKVLGSQSSLSIDILRALTTRLEDELPGIREAAVEALGTQSSLSIDILQALAALLEDQDPDVRRAAVKALKCQSSLPINILQALAARLDDQFLGVRQAAAEALKRQSSLPINILQALAARLDDQDVYITRSAAEALRCQSSLPNEVLTLLNSRFGNGRSDAIESVLRKNAAAYSTLLSGKSVKHMYKILLGRSWYGQLSWYIEDGHSCVNGLEGIRKASIEGNVEEFLDMIKEARPEGYPASNDLEMYRKLLLPSSPVNEVEVEIARSSGGR